MLWYYKLAGKVCGPLTHRELSDRIALGQISPQVEVGMSSSGPWSTWDRAIVQNSIKRPPQPAQTLAGSTKKAMPAAQRTSAARPPLPPPKSADPQLPDDTRNRRVIVASIAGGIALLLLIILLILLFSLRGCSAELGGGGTGTGGGRGAGHGEGVGDGSGAGSGAADEKKEGAGTDDQTPGNNSPAAPAESKQPAEAAPSGPEQSGQAPSPGDGAPLPPPPEHVVSLSPATPPKAASAEPAEKSGGGGGGGGTEGESEFFGVKAKGRKFVYIVDCSGSMSGQPFNNACVELLESVNSLQLGQSFFVMFFDHATYAQFYPNEEQKLAPATPKNKKRVRAWVEQCTTHGGTDPGDALMRALQMKPDAIFLLSDGEFPESVVTNVRAHNRRGVVINTIGFTNRSSERLLRRIAQENEGVYRFVP